MKKIIIFLFIFMILTISINEKENILIPKDAIRIRIIANSNDLKDQSLKMNVKDQVESELYDLIKDANNSSEARNIIKNNLNKVDNILKEYNVDYDIKYGNNFFPDKTYKGINYKSGYYESLVIKLGAGVGDNWWCVLFPPLCLLEDKENIDEKEYRLLATDLINKVNK